LIAWSKVDRAVRVVGTYESVIFDDALIHRVITDMGGWIQLGHKKEEEWPFVKNEFENRYRGYSLRQEKPEYPKVLIGISQSQNDQMGLSSNLPRLIGHPARAQLVFDNGGIQAEPILRLNESLTSLSIATDDSHRVAA